LRISTSAASDSGESNRTAGWLLVDANTPISAADTSSKGQENAAQVKQTKTADELLTTTPLSPSAKGKQKQISEELEDGMEHIGLGGPVGVHSEADPLDRFSR
jgi:hypothetical protein